MLLCELSRNAFGYLLTIGLPVPHYPFHRVARGVVRAAVQGSGGASIMYHAMLLWSSPGTMQI